MEVDYLRLSQQYGSFLLAIGGISITVLALLLSFAHPSSLLVAALLVAPISCFTGALMMAETAGFISRHPKTSPSGERLFLLASINIYIAVVLLVFALTLLPRESDKVKDPILIRLIPGSVFVGVIIAVLCWMVLSAIYRMPTPQRRLQVICAAVFGLACGIILYLIRLKSYRLQVSFIPILVFTIVSLVWFAWSFEHGAKVRNRDMWLFSFAITFTCASLGVARIWP